MAIQLERKEIVDIVKSEIKFPLRFGEKINRELVEIEQNITSSILRKFGIDKA